MKVKSIEEIIIPDHLVGPQKFNSEDEVIEWENRLILFFLSFSDLFTPFPDYFKARAYEFSILRQLLPEYFDLHLPYENILEIGCGYGFKSLLMSHMCGNLLGIDIPAKYKGYTRGNYETSVQIANMIVKDKFKLGNVSFRAMWPDKMDLADNSIQLVFSEYVLEHTPNLSEAIREMHRVMQKDAIMIHVVPNSKDPIITFIKANVNSWLKEAALVIAKKILKRNYSGKIKWNGLIVPTCHSEFLSDYSEQIETNSLENYLFPMLDAGFRIERIISTREHNNVIVARK